MKLGGILMAGALACIVGALMPDRPDLPAADGKSPQVAADAPGDQRPDYLTGEFMLQRQADGHFYAAPMINGVEVQTLVDTGASVVALTGDDAQTLGLNWNEDDLGVIAQGASGPIRGVEVRLDTVQLGSFEVHDVPAMIVPEGLPITLLGQSFLSRIPNVEIANGEMNLSEY